MSNKVNIDLYRADSIGGIYNYTREIAKSILSSHDLKIIGCCSFMRDRKHDTCLWFDGKRKHSMIPSRAMYQDKRAIHIPYEFLMKSYADINLFCTFVLPNVVFSRPVVSTIHDLLLFKTDCEREETIDKHKRILDNTVSKSCAIVTVSNNSKKDLCDFYSLDSDKIFVVHNGINESLFNVIDQDKLNSVALKYSLPEHYILYFGGYRRHKNIERLLQAYSLLNSSLRKVLKIVVTNRSKELIEKADNLNIQDDIIFTDFIAEEDKPSVFRMADMVYYASLYEGFGVPILEAQASSVPVITSNISSMPEAGGDGALYVNPYDIDGISNSIELLWEDAGLRKKLIASGLKNAMNYSWTKSGDEMNSAILSILKSI